jgi:hypothetical protein
MDDSRAIQTSQPSLPFYKNSASSWHRPFRADTNEGGSSINENLLNININLDTYIWIIEIAQHNYAGRELLQGTDALAAPHMQSKTHLELAHTATCN